VDKWLAKQNRKRGAIVKWEQLGELARLWYTDPRSEDWHPRTRDENQAVLTAAGLKGEFWELPK
jgi:hypothetical protein